MHFLNRHLKMIALLVAISFSACSGTFLLGVQVFAWTKMAGQFLKHDAPKLAFKKTFDGKHPCEICKHLREVRTKQSDHAPTSRPIRVYENLAFTRIASVVRGNFLPETKSQSWPNFEDSITSRSDAPPTPPPRDFSFV